jgi:Regulator of chromosome condensation (RCC1) repeat
MSHSIVCTPKSGRKLRGFVAVCTALAAMSPALVVPAKALAGSAASVVAWGRNSNAQATVPDSLAGITAVAGGAQHTMARRADGTVVAWGDNSWGQSDVPAGLHDVKAIAAPGFHSVALRADGTVVAWGEGNRNTPPADLRGVIAIAGGRNDNLALRGDGTVVAFPASTLTPPVGLTGVRAIAAGAFHALALRSDGTVVAWGDNTYAQASVPVGLANVMGLAGGGRHSLALKNDGTVVAWGDNSRGQSSVPFGLQSVVAIAAGSDHSLALKADGTVVAWGQNAEGQGSVPAGLAGVTAIAAGDFHNVVVRSPGFLPGVSGFQGVPPARLLDTRPTGVTVDGTFARRGLVGPSTTLDVQIADRAGIPFDGVGAVALNITAVDATAPTFVTLFPAGAPRPETSNLNLRPGQTVANLAVALLGPSGQVSLYNSAGNVHLIIDVLGWFPRGPNYTGVQPARLLDTRPGAQTTDGRFAGLGAVGPGVALNLDVAGRGGLPPTGVGSVVLNVTVVDPNAASFVTAYESGNPVPMTSNLNFVANQTVANLVIVPVSQHSIPGGVQAGRMTLRNEAGTTHLIADVVGWFPPSDSLHSIQPSRLLDTRPNATTIDGRSARGGTLGAGATLDLPVAGRGGVPPLGAGSVVLNVTAVDPTTASFLTVFPTGSQQPESSNVNMPAGRTVANLVIVPLGDNGDISIFNSAGATHLIADVLGWFPGSFPVAVPFPPTVPALLHDVRIGAHATFDRVVFEFENNIPGYRIGYDDLPLLGDFSGEPIPIQGDALIGVTFAPSASYDQTVDPLRVTYTGPSRLTVGLPSVMEVVKSGDFEATLSWGIGVRGHPLFHVFTLTSPPRVVIDIGPDPSGTP